MANERYSLFAGDIDGKLSEFFGKVGELNKKHNFAFVVVAGNLLAKAEEDEDGAVELRKLLRSEIAVPVTTYFSLGNRPLPPTAIERLEANDGELCTNLYLLGRKTTVKTSEGFKVVALGGKYSYGADEPMNPYEASFNDIDAQTAAKELDQADILITSDWPARISDGSKALYKDKAPLGRQCVADLCTRLKPRYHFSSSQQFYEREPFFQPGDSPRHITRFISLAPFGNAEKAKALYAFALEPSQAPPAKVPEGCTASPFTQLSKRNLDSQRDSFNNIRYANGNGQGGSGRDYGRRKKSRRGDTYMPPGPDQCFFCLSNGKVSAEEQHMITSVANNTYMTIAKGPLTTRDTFKSLGFPCHMLLIPVVHAATLQSVPDAEGEETGLREKTASEMRRYRSDLQQMVAAKSKGEDEVAGLGAVTYEISRAGGVHVHWQFVPVPVDMINKGLVEAGFEVLAQNLSYPKFAQDVEEATAAEQGDFFKVHIWTETFSREMILPLDPSFRFDLQFGRKVLAKLLGLDSRTDWRACKQTAVEEQADAEVFREAFKPFDFTLQ